MIINGTLVKINLQLHADPLVPAVDDLSEDEFGEELAKLPEVDSDNPESIQDFLESEEGEEGGDEAGKETKKVEDEESPAEDDPYGFIKKHTSFTDQESIVDGYKNLQGHATKETDRANKLQNELDGLLQENLTVKAPAVKAPAVDEYGDPVPEKGLSKEDIINVVSEQMKKSLDEDRESRSVESENSRLDNNYNEALALDGWAENADRVYGIIKEYPNIANNPSIANPYKSALEMAKNPELMKVYNKYPELLESTGGGLRVAQGLIPGEPETVKKIIDDAQNTAKDDETKRQIELQSSAVATPSSGDTGTGEKDVNDLSREEVYKRVGYTPED